MTIINHMKGIYEALHSIKLSIQDKIVGAGGGVTGVVTASSGVEVWDTAYYIRAIVACVITTIVGMIIAKLFKIAWKKLFGKTY